MSKRETHERRTTLILILDRRRLQPYRLLTSLNRDPRERGFLTPLALERHLTLIENVPDRIVRRKIREMETRAGSVVLEHANRGSLKSWPFESGEVPAASAPSAVSAPRAAKAGAPRFGRAGGSGRRGSTPTHDRGRA